MNQDEINRQIFAQLTFQKYLLEQISSFMLAGFPDKGEQFIREFTDRLAYKMEMNPAAAQETEDHAMRMQADSLKVCEDFFLRVRRNMGAA